jgi:hypothetical protein
MDTILLHTGIFLGIVLLVALVAAAIIIFIVQGAQGGDAIRKRLDLLEGIARRKRRKQKENDNDS